MNKRKIMKALVLIMFFLLASCQEHTAQSNAISETIVDEAQSTYKITFLMSDAAYVRGAIILPDGNQEQILPPAREIEVTTTNLRVDFKSSAPVRVQIEKDGEMVFDYDYSSPVFDSIRENVNF